MSRIREKMSVSEQPRLQRFADWLIRARIWLLLLSLLLVGLAWGPATRLKFDQSIESLYAAENPVLLAYQRSKHIFGGDEFAFVAWTDPDLNTSAGLERTEALAEQLEEIPGIEERSVQDLASALRPAKLPFLSLKEETLRELSRGILLGEDNQTTAVVARLTSEDRAPISRAETIERIRNVAESFAGKTGLRTYLVGEPIQVQEMFRYVEEDGLWLWIYSALLLIFVILILFRSVRWTLLPVFVVVVTVLWTRAVLVVSGMQLSMVSSMLNSLVTIIGIATVIHVAVNFRERRRSLDRVTALRDTLARLTLPIFWTCMTTAAGFAALISSRISPVQSFGIMMTLASMLVLVAAATLISGGALLGRYGAEVGQAPGEERLEYFLGRITHGVERHPQLMSILAIVLASVSLLGFFRLHVETDFSKNFRASSPIVQGLDFVETRLGGAGTWEVNFAAPAELTTEYLDQVRELAARLRELEIDGERPLTKVIALTDGLDLIPSIPFFTARLSQKLSTLERMQPEYLTSLYNPDAQRMRIMLRARERQPSETKLQLIEQVRATARETFDEAETTGLFVLLAFLIESLMRDQWVSFLLAAAGIGSLMTIAFGSLWIGLISLVPNVFPIVLVIGTMGWIGLPINIATAMIASVSMGLTVDSSIHFMSSYQRVRRRGGSFSEALHETHQGVGRALVFANFALVCGFLVLTASHFIPLVYFGVLVSVAMLGGLIGNLVLLPLLLRLVR